MNEFHSSDSPEIQQAKPDSFTNIQSETDLNVSEAKNILQSLFVSLIDANNAPAEKGVTETADSQNDVHNNYYSTYEERLKQTPGDSGERGEWSEDRGESDFKPNDQEIQDILAKHGLESIPYKDGIPDFSKVSEATVEIDEMSENRSENFKQCDEKCAEQWNKEAKDGKNDWTARDVKEWRQENGYSWHERNDMKTCDLVPTKINDYFGHLGGVSECKKRDSENSGGEFDE
ncbi:MAG: HNH endonuclease [Clostridiales bacterium]|nr:HNH endonuclease [Clostridiales bacterium]